MSYWVEVVVQIGSDIYRGKAWDDYATFRTESFPSQTGARFMAGKIMNAIRRVDETEGARERERSGQESGDG